MALLSRKQIEEIRGEWTYVPEERPEAHDNIHELADVALLAHGLKDAAGGLLQTFRSYILAERPSDWGYYCNHVDVARVRQLLAKFNE